MSDSEVGHTVSETIVIVDMVRSTSLAVWHGWDIAGRPIIRALRSSIEALGRGQYGLACRKFTGDGYMLTFDKGGIASLPSALSAVSALSRTIAEWNRENDRLCIKLRFAVHFGGVEKHFDNDREGLEVAFAFRLEGVDSIEGAWGCDPRVTALPECDYAILSDPAVEILKLQRAFLPWRSLGAMPIKSFGRREVFLLENISQIDAILRGDARLQSDSSLSL